MRRKGKKRLKEEERKHDVSEGSGMRKRRKMKMSRMLLD